MGLLSRFCYWLFSGRGWARFTLVISLTLMILFGSCFPGCEYQRTKVKRPGRPVAGKLVPYGFVVPEDVDRPSILAVERVVGTWRWLVVCVDFVDKPALSNPLLFDSLIFEPNVVSVRDFYDENSRGMFTIVTVNLPSSIGWIRAPQSYGYYVDSSYGMGPRFPRNSRGLTRDIVLMIDSLIDFSKYDNDGDGTVDAITIIHSGGGAESGKPGSIWSHKGSIASQNLYVDGKKMDSFVMCPEFVDVPGDATIGIFAHEWGHVLGLPDLYDYDGSSNGVGRWSLMASGSWNGRYGNGESPAHLDPWCKAKLGWITPTNVDGNVLRFRLPPIEETGVCLRLWSNGVKGPEYFLVANSQRTGYDSRLPWEGLLVWHIDETQGRNTNEWWPGNPAPGNYLVALEQMDGRWELEHKGNYGDPLDPLPIEPMSKTSFTPNSVPNSRPYSGGTSLIAITNCYRDGDDIVMDVSVSTMSGVFDDEEAGPSLELNVHIFPIPFSDVLYLNITPYDQSVTEVKISDVLGREVMGLKVRGENFYDIMWDGVSSSGVRCPSGVYFVVVKNCGKRVVSKAILLK